jgi:hypothetical protein
VKRLIWSSVLVLFLGAVAGENLRDFLWHLSGRQPLHIVFAALKLGFGVLLAILTTVGVLGVIRGVRIAVSQRRDERRGGGV